MDETASLPNRTPFERMRTAARHAALPLMLLLTTFAPAARAQEQQLPVVTAAKPVVREIVEDDEFVGRFEAVDEVAIRSRVSGYLDEVHFKDGAVVNKGDLLFTIDQRPYQAAFDAAKSQVDVAKSLLDFTKMQLDRAEELCQERQHPDRDASTTAGANIWPPQAQMQGAHGSADDGQPQSRIHRDQGAAGGPHRPPAGVGRQPRAAGLDAADDDRRARSDRLLFRRR